MDNLEKYGFCPYSDQVNLDECNPFVSVCSDCDIFFKGFERGKKQALEELIEFIEEQETISDLEVLEIKNHIQELLN